jgi:YVTN family beta-propeller protein
MHQATAAIAIAIFALGCGSGSTGSRAASESTPANLDSKRLSTGARLDPAGRSIPVGNMPLAASLSPDGKHVVLALSGWRQQGIDVVSRATGTVVQHIEQPGAFIGLAWSGDGRSLYVSGGAADVVYRYTWQPNADHPATLADSIALGHGASGDPGTRYPAGIAISPDRQTLYVAENLSDSLAVIDLATNQVTQRVFAGRFPYAVAGAADGRVYVSAWGGSTVTAFVSATGGRLTREGTIEVGRHPSALAINAAGSRLFAASASTDRVAVVDTRKRAVVAWLLDPPPDNVREGSTPNALALSSDGTRLFAAEADNNAVAVFDLSATSSGVAAARGADRLSGRIPAQWYPTAILPTGDSLWVVNGKGRGTGPNLTGPRPNVPLAQSDPRGYTLGQLDGTITVLPATSTSAALDAFTSRVAVANGWNTVPRSRAQYPPIEHVIYIIKENRTYDQVLGDLPQGDGDSSLTFFPRNVSPNHHALAERFGVFDRFFVNAEVSAQGHMWSMAGYVTDYGEKTTPDVYRSKRPDRDDADDIDEPATGFLWAAAAKKGLLIRNYGEFAEPVHRASGDTTAPTYQGSRPSMRPFTSPTYPPYDLSIRDQRRADAWLAEFREHERTGRMPALETMHLPSDHTAGGRRGLPTPKAYMADNDLALARIVDALSHSQFWKSTAVFVLEDDAQAGPDHIDSHRSVLLVISPWSVGGVLHRFVNTTDVLATVEEILGIETLSQFDHFGRPLRDIWRTTPDLRPYAAVAPSQSMTEMNLALDDNARRSARLDLAREDRAPDDEFNRILWRAIKGDSTPYPGTHRAGVLEWTRGR